jgi:ankyrin repeat protein
MENVETLIKIREAVENGNLEQVAALIGNDERKRDMATVFGSWLHVAATHGQLAVVKWLVEAGIDINNHSGIAGGTALNEAALEGHLNVVRYLLENGAELDVSESERNPLFSAVNGGHLEIVRFLLEHGMDARVGYSGPAVKDFDAHAFAVEQGQRQIAAYLRDWLQQHNSRASP